jgi:hypothetical protein
MSDDFPETFYASDRASAKGHAEYPLTLEYIERLERIAKAAAEYWANSSSTNGLFEALDSVNFMRDRP